MQNEDQANDAARPEDDGPEPGNESCDRDPPEVRAAAEAVEKAKAKLREARECYERVRKEAVEKVERVRESRVGDVIDGVLRFVRKHPGPGVILAILAGFFLGRGLRR